MGACQNRPDGPRGPCSSRTPELDWLPSQGLRRHPQLLSLSTSWLLSEARVGGPAAVSGIRQGPGRVTPALELLRCGIRNASCAETAAVCWRHAAGALPEVRSRTWLCRIKGLQRHLQLGLAKILTCICHRLEANHHFLLFTLWYGWLPQ